MDAGYYEIVETKYPDGYIQTTESPIFQVQYEIITEPDTVIDPETNEETNIEKIVSVKPNIFLVHVVNIASEDPYESEERVVEPIIGNKTDMVRFDVENKDFIIGNTPGAALPNTGGPGINLLYLLGIMLTGFAGTRLVMKKRRRDAA